MECLRSRVHGAMSISMGGAQEGLCFTVRQFLKDLEGRLKNLHLILKTWEVMGMSQRKEWHPQTFILDTSSHP